MGKRLFFVLPVLFVFSLLFVQVSEAGGGPGTVIHTITEIGFYTDGEVKGQDGGGNQPPQSQNIVVLSSSQTVHRQNGGETAPNISDFVYTGNIPNGSFTAIGCYMADPDYPVQMWFRYPFDSYSSPTTHTFTDSSRKLIKIIMSENPYATVTDL